MTIETTNLSYTHERMEQLINNFLLITEGPLRFETTYGCGEMLDAFPNQTIDLDDMKEQLFIEFDNLWKELADR
jgi:hypothetical protein